MNKYEERRRDIRIKRNIEDSISIQIEFADKYIFPVVVAIMIAVIMFICYGVFRLAVA